MYPMSNAIGKYHSCCHRTMPSSFRSLSSARPLGSSLPFSISTHPTCAYSTPLVIAYGSFGVSVYR